MDPKKKTKIWIIIFIITLSAAGGLAVLLSKKSTLFKGSYILPPSTALTISLDQSITNQTIVPGGSGYVAGFRLANPSTTPINILSFNLHKTGTLENSKIKRITLYETTTKKILGSEISRVPATGPVRWEATKGDVLFMIAAKTTAQFVVEATVNNTAAAKKNFRFSVNGKADVGISGSNLDPVASPNYPLQGPIITVGASPPATKPDLVAESLSWTPTNITAGAQVIFSANVRNAGTAATTPNFAVRFCIDNTECASSTTGRLGIDSVHTAALQQNGLNQMLSVAWAAAQGDHNVTFCVDITNIVTPEASENNNCTSSSSFSVGAAATPVQNQPPNKPILSEPINSIVVSSLTPTLKWQDGGDPDNGPSVMRDYRWQISDKNTSVTAWQRGWGTPNGETDDCAVDLPNNRWGCPQVIVPAGKLEYSKTYLWKIEAGDGQNGSGYSNAAEFQTPAAPVPPTVTVTASRPAGQSEQIPAIANQTVKLATINISQSGGDPMLTRLKRIVLEYQTADNPLEINKITDLHLFRGDSSEFTLGTTGKDLNILSKNGTNGTIEAVFQTVTPVSVIGDPRNQSLTLYAKINGAAGDNGKKIKYVLKSVEFEPGDGDQTNLNIAVPEFTMHEDPPDAPGATFQTSPASINRGQSSTLSWNVANATTITIDNGIGTVSGVGTRVVNPTTDTTYTLTASNAGGEVTRTTVVAVAQPAAAPPPPPPGGGTPAPQTCEQQGLKTYTGPPKPGERVTGMCIACTTEQYIANGGTCEAKKKKKVGNMDAGLPRAGGGQGTGASGAAATGGASAGAITQPSQGGQRGAAPDQTPNLGGSQRLVRAPERANTGPEALVYLGILGVVHAGLWLRRKIKQRQ